MAETPKYPVKTLEKSIEILNILYNESDFRGLGITEIGNKTGLNKSVVHRIMDTLLFYSLVEKDPETARYRLGWGLFTMAQKVPQQNHLYSLSIGYLLDLNKAVNSTVNLGILRGTDSLIISKIEANTKDSMLRLATQAGDAETAYATSLGKAMLSDMDDDDIRELFKSVMPFAKLTPNTVANIDELIDRIHEVRELGYAVDNEELSIGMICMARPVRDYTGKVVAAVSVSSPSSVMTEDRKKIILDNLAICVSNISRSLGYRE